MGNRRPRRKTARRDAAHQVPDEVLELVFLRLTSLFHLVCVACTCKPWRRIVADKGFLRRFHSLHAPAILAGVYRAIGSYRGPRAPGLFPVFFPSPSPSPVVHVRRFSLNFLPGFRDGCWQLADSRGSLLLLTIAEPFLFQSSGILRSGMVVCEPLTRRYRAIPPSAWFPDCRCLGAFLLDGDDDEAGGNISLSNFRIICVVHRSNVARACVFSSRGGVWTAACRTPMALRSLYFAGSSRESIYWKRVMHTIVLDKDTAQLSSSVSSEHVCLERPEWRPDYTYPYHLPWPPTFRACLTL